MELLEQHTFQQNGKLKLHYRLQSPQMHLTRFSFQMYEYYKLVYSRLVIDLTGWKFIQLELHQERAFFYSEIIE